MGNGNRVKYVHADLLPALKGEGSLRADHGFVVYRLHFITS
jgi:hypothetical protein